MSKLIHYLHKSVHTCSGYQEFLEDMAKGKYTKFNPLFFFIFPFWLIMHKMYFHFIFLLFFYLNLPTLLDYFFNLNTEQGIKIMMFTITFFHILFTFYSYKIYYLHLEYRFSKAEYEATKCMKIAQPIPFYLTPVIMLAMVMAISICFYIIQLPLLK